MLRPSFFYKINFLMLLFFLILISSSELFSQCPMCRTSVESAMNEETNNVGKGLNKGILYLLSFPYLLIGSIASVYFYKRYKNKKLKNV